MISFENLLKDSGITRSNGYDFYFKNYIFKDIDLNNKTIMDLGGGNGIASFYALTRSPTCRAWVVDPLSQGSNNRMMHQFKYLEKYFDKSRINFHRGFIDSLLKPEKFNIVIMHNSINHIGEDIIANNFSNKKFFYEFKIRLEKILNRLITNGILIVADCGKYNFLGNLGLKNPLAPTIKWDSHCQPNTWQIMIEDIGFKHLRTEWTARRELGYFGKLFLSNSLCSYFLNSHFVSFYKKS